MRRIRSIGVLSALVAGLTIAPTAARAANCGGEPLISGSASWKAYKNWCRCMGGSVSDLFEANGQVPCRLPNGVSPGSASGSGSGDYSGAEEAGRRARRWVDCKLFGKGCPETLTNRQDPGNALSDQGVQAYNQAEAERQQAEAARIERERLAEEKRKKERDAKFISDRDAMTLKGGIGTSVSPNDGGLKGSRSVDTGLKELRVGDRVDRDLQGPQAAWKQLHCAAALSGYVFAALSKPTPDYQESSYLAGQASKALAGESLGVECGKAPPMPDLRGNAADWDRLRQTQQRMIERAATLSEHIQAGQQARSKYEPVAPAQPARALTPDEQRIQDAFRQQQENQARLERRDGPVIAAQNAINRGQERKYDPKDAAAIREEQKAKAELDKYVDASRKLESGDPSAMLNLGISLGEEPPRARRRGSGAP